MSTEQKMTTAEIIRFVVYIIFFAATGGITLPGFIIIYFCDPMIRRTLYEVLSRPAQKQ